MHTICTSTQLGALTLLSVCEQNTQLATQQTSLKSRYDPEAQGLGL